MEQQENVVLEKKLVQILIRDMMERVGFDLFLKNTDPTVSVKMYEKWTQLVSKELHKNGIVDKIYEPKDIENMKFWDSVIVRESFYIGDDVK